MSVNKKQHYIEIQKNKKAWESKEVLQRVFYNFYKLINNYINRDVDGKIVELGSGIGSFKTVVPDCICTDIFDNPWIDQKENAYNLSFSDNSVSNIILFDVFHHIEYPGTAFKELYRVLNRGGRLIIFDAALGLLGLFVYGLFHHEPLNLCDDIKWFAPDGFHPEKAVYYAAQANAYRIFFSKEYKKELSGWEFIVKKKISAISYIASGGYSKMQLYPAFFLPYIWHIETICDLLPVIFATRSLIVMGKK